MVKNATMIPKKVFLEVHIDRFLAPAMHILEF
jgi:hypothetical protein